MESISNISAAGKSMAVPFFIISQTISVLNSATNFAQTCKRIKKMEEDERNNTFASDKLQQDLDYLRKSYEENISFQSKQIKQQFDNMRSQSQFAFFCDKFWKDQFGMTINSLQYPIEELSHCRPSDIKIQLMVARTAAIDGLTSAWGPAAGHNYRTLCSHIKEKIGANKLFSTSFINAWCAPSKGVAADTMLLYYIMQGLPTVILFLDRVGDRIAVDVALWSLQTGLDKFMTCRLFETETTESTAISDSYDLLCASAAYCGDALKTGLSLHQSKQGTDIIANIISKDIREKALSEYNDGIAAFQTFNLNHLTHA